MQAIRRTQGPNGTEPTGRTGQHHRAWSSLRFFLIELNKNERETARKLSVVQVKWWQDISIDTVEGKEGPQWKGGGSHSDLSL